MSLIFNRIHLYLSTGYATVRKYYIFFYKKKHSGVQYRCTEFQSMIFVDESTLIVSKGPIPHLGHEASSVCSVLEMKAIIRMKESANTDMTNKKNIRTRI